MNTELLFNEQFRIARGLGHGMRSLGQQRPRIEFLKLFRMFMKREEAGSKHGNLTIKQKSTGCSGTFQNFVIIISALSCVCKKKHLANI